MSAESIMTNTVSTPWIQELKTLTHFHTFTVPFPSIPQFCMSTSMPCLLLMKIITNIIHTNRTAGQLYVKLGKRTGRGSIQETSFCDQYSKFITQVIVLNWIIQNSTGALLKYDSLLQVQPYRVAIELSKMPN